jgi:hypothetical protein
VGLAMDKAGGEATFYIAAVSISAHVRRRTSLDHASGEGHPHQRRCVMALFLKPLLGFTVSSGALTAVMMLLSHAS